MNQRELFVNSYLHNIANQFGFKKIVEGVQTPDLDAAFEVFSIAVVLDKPFSEVKDNIVVRGKNDGGFDGIYFDMDSDYCEAYFFQCKNTKTLKQNELDKFRGDFNDVFQAGNSLGKPLNSDILGKLNIYQEMSRHGVVINPSLYFIFNGEKNSTECQFNHELYNSNHRPDDGVYIYDISDLYDRITEFSTQRKRKLIEIPFAIERSNISHPTEPQAIISFSIENIKSLTFRLPAVQICELIEQEIKTNKHKDFLFAENIRGFLGRQRKTNKKIMETIESGADSIYFPFFNNGITMICEKAVIPRLANNSYTVKLTNPVIVNGLQTSEILYSYYKKESKRDLLDYISVMVKVCETSDPDIIRKITEATNTQSSINYADQLSTSDFNKYAQQLFLNHSIGYIVKRGETFTNNELRNIPETVEHKTLFKFWYATFFEQPEIAKVSLAAVMEKIYDAINNRNNLKKLFGEGINSPALSQLLRVYKIYKHVTEQRNKQKSDGSMKNDFILYADEMFCYGVHKKLQKEVLLLNDDTLGEAYSCVYGVINSIVDAKKSEYDKGGMTYSHNNYFKSSMSRRDYNKEAGILEIEDDAILVDILLR